MNSNAPRSVVTIRDIAQRLGLSTASVSLGLRDSPKISEQRREEIKAMALEMGYTPNSAATALSQYRKASKETPVQGAIAWLNFWPNPKELRTLVEYDRYWEGANDAAKKLGYHLEEFCVCGISPTRLSQILHARGINGILLPPHRMTPDLSGFNWQDFSVVRLGHSLTGPKCHLVGADQVGNMLVAFNQAKARGYRRIGFVTGNASRLGALFDAGYLRVQRSVEDDLRLPICSIANTSLEEASELIQQWVEQNGPDAVLTDANIVPEALRRIGYEVPRDFGFAAMSTLDVETDTGIDQNPRETGKVAVHALNILMTTNERGIPDILNQTLVMGQWVEGTSLPHL